MYDTDPERVAVVKGRVGMKRAARSTNEKTTNIFNDNVAALNKGELARFPKIETMLNPKGRGGGGRGTVDIIE